MLLKVVSVVGARPNFMKIAALCNAIMEFNKSGPRQVIHHILVHTGQHYDFNMSGSFFDDLDLPTPDIFLEVGSASHSEQTARILERFDGVLHKENPDLVIVVGDVNSTMACALVTKKTWCVTACASGKDHKYIPALAHIEAGLRSFDRTMPEEVNRVVTDCLSDYLFTTEESANRNLLHEGISENKIHFVGNVMIDTLLQYQRKAQQSTILTDLKLLDHSGVSPYAVLTLHRPSNVDDSTRFSRVVNTLVEVSSHVPVIFPAHPRTLKEIQRSEMRHFFSDHTNREASGASGRITLIPSLGYLDFVRLISEAKVVLTDSGGVQEETSILGVPCLTLRDTTERPVTVESGTK